jgi:hypothetical protein
MDARAAADPWTDTDVIDARAPRFNQTVVGTVALLGVVFGWPLAWALMALQLLVGLLAGRRFCLPCLAYFMLIQPRLGEGPLEDSRPPRLANALGCGFLAAAALGWWLGAPAVGTALGAIVAALALVAAVSGFCTGCQLYRLSARLHGISAGGSRSLDPGDIEEVAGGSPAFVEFSHPLCADCRRWEERLAGEEHPLLKIDVRERPDLASKYGIAVVPTVLLVDSSGTVLNRLAP